MAVNHVQNRHRQDAAKSQRSQRKTELEERLQRDREAIVKVLTEDKKREQGETLSVLDALRRTRKARGGVGAPLAVPAHLKDAAAGQGIVITDADLTANFDPSRSEKE